MWPLMQDYKRNAYMEADLRCSNTIQRMEKRLRTACHASDANVDNVVKVCIHSLVALAHGVRGIETCSWDFFPLAFLIYIIYLT